MEEIFLKKRLKNNSISTQRSFKSLKSNKSNKSMKSLSGKLKVDPVQMHEHNSLMTFHRQKIKEINKKDPAEKV